MDDESRMPTQPPLNFFRLMGGIVVHDDMQFVVVVRPGKINFLEELQKLLAAVARISRTFIRFH